MAKLLALISAIALCACDQALNLVPAQTAEPQVKPSRLPFDNSADFLDGYSLRVFRGGALRWNGAQVSEAEMESYLNQWSALPPEAGRLSVAFEPGVSPTRSGSIRQKVIDSGLCEQRRCMEVGWDVKRPVVY